MKSKGIISIIFVLAVGNASQGQWTNYTNSNSVRQIMTGDNKVWGATSGGVIAYTPSTAEILKLTNTDGLGGIDFICLERDTSANYWFGTSNGWLCKLQPDNDIVNYAFKDSSGGFFARAVYLFDLEIDGEALWVANDLGVSKFLTYSNGGEIKDTARRLGNIQDGEDVICVEIIGNNLWAGTASGVAFIDKDNVNIQNYAFWRSFSAGQTNGLGNLNIKTITSFQDTVLVGTQNGIYKLLVAPDTTWVLSGLSNLVVYRLFSRNSDLFAAADDGVYRYEAGTWAAFPMQGLPSNIVNDITVDSVGNIWAGTPNSGLGGFANSTWQLYSIPGPASNFIRNIAIDSSGAIWMTHDSKGVSKFDDGIWTIYNYTNSDPDGDGPLQGLVTDGAYALTVASDGIIWMGDYGGGLYKYDGISWYHWDINNSPMWGVGPGSAYWANTAVEEDTEGNIWMTALDADSGVVLGVFAPTDSVWEVYYTGPNLFPDNDVEELCFQDDILLVGRQAGLDKLDFGNTPFEKADDVLQTFLSRKYILDIDIDPFGNIWFGALTGVYYIPRDEDEEVFIPFPIDMGGRTNAVAADAIGNIWVGSFNGMGVLGTDRITWQTFNTSNSPLLNNTVNCITIDDNSGLVYIGTDAGLSIFDSGNKAPSQNLDEVYAYPNPVLVNNGDNIVRFRGRPAEGKVIIYDLSGEKINELNFNQLDYWDLNNSRGEPVAAGIYIFYIKTPTASGTGKIAVIK